MSYLHQRDVDGTDPLRKDVCICLAAALGCGHWEQRLPRGKLLRPHGSVQLLCGPASPASDQQKSWHEVGPR